MGVLTRLFRGGTEGNARLTALTGVVLLALLAAEGVTILDIRGLLAAHVFIGLLLIPPVALKLGAAGYRLLRYYARAADYVRKGPPIVLMRMLVAPGLVAATLVVFATGIALLVVGPRGGLVLTLHQASFFVWLGAFGLHVLVYALRVPGLVMADWRRESPTSGASVRVGVVAFALLLGVTLALAVLPAANAWLHLRGD
ncbi:MAG: hypothetical protein QOE13_145 [Gaiellaceae bacterium]|nr:hypothetical protein [Gaiellaceae bacterium]